jgi:hypothetical protein
VSKILLNYVFPVSVVSATPQASTASLKQVCVVAKPKSGQESNVGKVFLCTTMTQVGVRTNNTEAQRLFDAGMSRVYILLSNDLDIAAAMDANAGKFFTVLISSDFADDDFDDDGAAAVAAARTVGDLTFTALPGVAGNDLSVELLNQTDAGEEVVHVIGDKISILMKGGTSTAQQIKDACENSVQFLATGVTVSIAAGHASTAQAAAAEADLTGGSAATAAGLLLGGFDGVVGVASSDDTFVAAQAAIEKRAAFHTTTANKAKNMFYAFGKLLSNQLNWLNQQFITMPVADDVDEAGEAESLFDSKVSFVLSDDDYGNRLALFAVGGKAIVAPYIFKTSSSTCKAEPFSGLRRISRITQKPRPLFSRSGSNRTSSIITSLANGSRAGKSKSSSCSRTSSPAALSTFRSRKRCGASSRNCARRPNT